MPTRTGRRWQSRRDGRWPRSSPRTGITETLHYEVAAPRRYPRPPYLAAQPLWHRRFRPWRHRPLGLPPWRAPAALAGAPARAHRLWRLAVRGRLGVRRQSAADLAATPRRGWAARRRRPDRSPGVPGGACGLRARHAVEDVAAAPRPRRVSDGGGRGPAPRVRALRGDPARLAGRLRALRRAQRGAWRRCLDGL